MLLSCFRDTAPTSPYCGTESRPCAAVFVCGHPEAIVSETHVSSPGDRRPLCPSSIESDAGPPLHLHPSG